jgi:hypothetical protein
VAKADLEILLKAGHRKTEVAWLTGVSLCSVKRIAQEGPVVHVDDAAERAQPQIGRPSTVANFRKPILEILQQTPDLASLEILRQVRESGYEGGDLMNASVLERTDQLLDRRQAGTNPTILAMDS